MTKVDLRYNQIGEEGAQHLDDVFREDKVRVDSSLCHSYLSFVISQTLMKLKLEGNRSDLAVAIGISIALRNDKVIHHFFIYTFIKCMFYTDTNCFNIKAKFIWRPSDTTYS